MHRHKGEQIIMMDISELKRRQSEDRMPSFGETQEMGRQMPALVQQLQKQALRSQHMLKEQTDLIKKQSALIDAQTDKQEKLASKQTDVMMMLHDRLDALITESRVTNLLLSEMVAIHHTLIKDNTDKSREAVRSDAYARVLNGR